MNEKHFFIGFCLVVSLLMGSIAALSYIEDPGGAFTKNIKEASVAKILLSGHNAANVGNMNERFLQKAVIQNDPRQINTIVLGSSRSMQIGRSVTCQTFFNHGMNAATVEDFVAIIELYQEKGTMPRSVIIGVDPWVFNGFKTIGGWISLNREYQYGIARISSTDVQTPRVERDGFENDIDRYTYLISRPVVVASVKQFFNKQYYPTDEEELDVDIRLKDGTLSYPREFQTRTVGQVNSDATRYANEDPVYGLGRFDNLEPHYQKMFEATIHYLQKANTTIILFLPPYHPIVYEKFTTDSRYRTVGEAESYVKSFARNENITVVGSYDPNCLNLTSEDFFDGMHPRREAVEKIITERLSCTDH